MVTQRASCCHMQAEKHCSGPSLSWTIVTATVYSWLKATTDLNVGITHCPPLHTTTPLSHHPMNNNKANYIDQQELITTTTMCGVVAQPLLHISPKRKLPCCVLSIRYSFQFPCLFLAPQMHWSSGQRTQKRVWQTHCVRSARLQIATMLFRS